MGEEFGPAYWEDRYSRHHAHPTPAPSPHLVEAVAGLPTGSVLEVGCGEGANAVWLAEQGWSVTAVDVSPTALDRARELAESRGPAVADRLRWREADLMAWDPPADHFDLVTAHYVHPSGADSAALLRRMAAAAAPGGTLLVVDHDHGDEHAHATTSVEAMAAVARALGWEVVVADTRVRRDGPGTLHDAVLQAHRPV
jgi:SAM-dependent methyltransferase